MSNKPLHMISFILVIVGGLNWGLVGLFQFDLVAALFGFSPLLTRLVYVVVAAAAVYLAATHKGDCRACAGESNRVVNQQTPPVR